ncbi:MAG TPA: type VI secretion system contractile sheath small subunit [Gemmatimonadaceae bacterium]|jgi:type VI secretion system protein ImpB
MAREGTQKKLERVRPPRVNISYDVETGGAIETKELPFLMGVLADLSGTPAEALPRLKDRKFVEITPDNFDSVLKNMKPRVNFAVENKLQEGGGKIGVDITFESMDDFSPEAVAKQVGPLKELLDLRTKLADLRGSLQGNDKLEEILQNTLNDAGAMKKLESELGSQGGGNG